VSLPEMVLTKYVDPKFAPVDALGLRSDELALIWLRDQESNWFNDAGGKDPAPIEGLECTLLDLPDGDYEIEWWDTRQGVATAVTHSTAEDGRLVLRAPKFLRDIAGKVRRR